MSDMPAIATFGLSKKYKGAKSYALKGLDLNVMPGEVYGFLGPNGAGKSTTIKLLMNFIQPTHGHALVLDQDVTVNPHKIKKEVGYLSGEIALYSKMTGWQFLDYMAALQKPKHKDHVRRLAQLFEAPLQQTIGTLSRGNRQKIGVIQAFMSEPDVLVLDEPTSGLDPLMQETFFELVRVTKSRGACIFLSSHNLSEVQKICDRIGFIKDGELISEQTIADFKNLTVQTYDVVFDEKLPLTELRGIPGAKVRQNSSHHATVKVQGDLKAFFRVLSAHKVQTIDRQEINLEQEFMKFYRGDKK